MKVDYDDRLYRVYEKGRALSADAQASWMMALVGHAPTARPLTVLDLGSGTGRFSPALAETFGGPVYGVEPSIRMREVAAETNPHPDVSYLDGRAESIPLADAMCDLGLLYFVLHHLQDRPAAASELARVVRPRGVLFVRTGFGDRIAENVLYDYFPRVRALERDIFPTLSQIRTEFADAGFTLEALDSVRFEVASSLSAYLTRIEQRAISTLELLSEEEIEAGLDSLRRDAATAPDRPVIESGDLLVLRRDPES